MATLMKSDKRKVSAQLKTEIARNMGHQQLNELLDVVLNPRTSLDSSENLDWCRSLIAGGVAFEDFAKSVRHYDNASTCGLVWTSNFVAYRCRTCGISPCMSICADCFHGADHTDHDFNMFRSQAGGACDCGDPNVMRSAGFCSLHGPDKLKNLTVPADLLPMADAVVPRVVFRFVLYLRDIFEKRSEIPAVRFSLSEGEPLLGLLHELCNMGGAMRSVMTRALTDQQLYKDLNEGSSGCYSQFKRDISQSREILNSAQSILTVPESPKFLRGNPAVTYPLMPLSFVEELLFWAVIFEFPEKIVTLLLKMLPDNSYKDTFTRSFVKFYGRIAMSLATSTQPDKLSSRVVHISVQLFSNEELAIQMTEELQLIHILIVSLQCLLKRTLMDNHLKGTPGTHRNCQVINCDHQVMRQHCYWPVISDLSNILSHRSVVNKFFTDPSLVKMWTNILAMFMCMNLNERELHNHVEFEPLAYSAAFSAEIEACAAPMWQLYVHCKDESTAHYTEALLNACSETITDWLEAADVYKSLDPYQVSFHIPLLRYYALFLSQAVTKQGLAISPQKDFLKSLMNFPLQIQALVGEISCGLWVRNGFQIKRQAITYMQCHFCASMIDLDLFLLQACAAHLDPDYFVEKVFSSFKVLEMLTFNQSHSHSQLELDKESAMLESALTLLVTLLSTRTHLGATEEELLRQEMVALLCMHDTTHSRLTDQIPEKTGLFSTSESFEPLLAEVADYHDPLSERSSRGLQQGHYSPKPSVWETEFDPIHVLLRCMQKKDFQSAMDRYSTHMKQTAGHSGNSDLWPPFQPLKQPHPALKTLHQLLHCKTLHGAIFIILHKAVNSKSISEPVLYLCIALLDMMLQCPADTIASKTPTPAVIQDGNFSAMFPDNLILSNLGHRIHAVEIVYEKPSSSRQRTVHSTDQLLQQLLEEEVSIIHQNLFGLAPMGFPGAAELEGMEEGEEMYVEIDGIGEEEEIDGIEEDEDEDVEEMEMEVGLGEELYVDTPATSEGAMATEASSSRSSVEPSTSPSASAGRPRKPAKVSTVLWTPSKMLTINLSMLELLVKLHAKMAGKEGSYTPPSMRRDTEAGSLPGGVQVGGGMFYVKRLLDKICRMHPESQKQLEDLCRLHQQPTAGTEQPDAQSTAADRRKKAREAQQKLFAKLAAEQKKFIEKSLETDPLGESPIADEEVQAAAAEKVPDREIFECVICGQTAPSTGDKPIGMVALMQATGVLGHRSQVSEAKTLPTSENEMISTTGRGKEVNQQRKLDLLNHFDKSSVQMSINVGWHGGVHIQSCRHYIHLSCHESYIKSLRQQDYQTPQLQVREKGEYECPLCRQLANFVLPCLPFTEGCSPSVAAASSDSRSHAVVAAEVAEKLRLSREGSRESLKDITLAAKSVFLFRLLRENRLPKSAYGDPLLPVDHSEMVDVVLRSTARVNLELDLVVRETLLQPSSQSSSNKRGCIGTLLEVLSLLIGKSSVTLATKPWSMLTELKQISGASEPRSSGSPDEIPVLLKDPVATLINLVLAMQHPISKEHFSCIVRTLYAPLYIQALSVISCRMPDTERRAWAESGKTCQAQSNELQMQPLLSQVINMYSNSTLYDDTDLLERLAICQSVWTLQCIETAAQEYCLPFLRIAALMQHHLFRDELPTCQKQDLEFELLVNYLRLYTAPSVGETPADLYSARCLHFVGNPSEFMKAWCQDLLTFVRKNRKTAKSLLLHNPIFYPPRLLQLPKNYDAVFQYYREQRCQSCLQVPNRPAVCLVCGALICLNGARSGCQRSSITEQHYLSCGAGTVIYLDINSSSVVIVRGERICHWASVYLDRHGEEDRELKRGKPLFLCLQRYKVLEQLWRSHSFNHCCKNWMWHLTHHH
ncbi:E3 ubiquitin-protein ligase UBR3-like isoform X3 [Patiria miniata]|uniref:E3 ubiquitin-protein ligase n=1 Tax=Patiria miniata TaxID=46514 RepID=A0A914BJX2_PATMI|nr:E3 ubiquitin-protein ligase UBR3-like isoform X3 [Patiria miniata]